VLKVRAQILAFFVTCGNVFESQDPTWPFSKVRVLTLDLVDGVESFL